MFIYKQKRINIYAPFEDDEGNRYGQLIDPILRYRLGVQEIPDPVPPEDYTDETYYRTEQDDAPYVIYTKKTDEQLAQLAKSKIIKQIEQLEAEITPRRIRDAITTTAGKNWLKDKEAEIDTLRVQLQ